MSGPLDYYKTCLNNTNSNNQELSSSPPRPSSLSNTTTTTTTTARVQNMFSSFLYMNTITTLSDQYLSVLGSALATKYLSLQKSFHFVKGGYRHSSQRQAAHVNEYLYKVQMDYADGKLKTTSKEFEFFDKLQKLEAFTTVTGMIRQEIYRRRFELGLPSLTRQELGLTNAPRRKEISRYVYVYGLAHGGSSIIVTTIIISSIKTLIIVVMIIMSI